MSLRVRAWVQIARALPVAIEADAVLRVLRKEKREPTADEAALIDRAEAMRETIIQACAPWTNEVEHALDKRS